MQAYTTNLVHSLVKVASSALVLSSIGFGAVFAFKASIHGILLAGLAVLMAAALGPKVCRS
jgi:predicted membrane protein